MDIFKKMIIMVSTSKFHMDLEEMVNCAPLEIQGACIVL